MRINEKEFYVRNLRYIIRLANENDAKNLSEVRVQIDGETENMDREKGEAYIDELGFKQLIKEDTETSNNLFWVCETNGKIVGFSRCQGNVLKRMAHKVEYGICVLIDFWGYSIGTNLLKETIRWSDTNQIKKKKQENRLNQSKQNGKRICRSSKNCDNCICCINKCKSRQKYGQLYFWRLFRTEFAIEGT
ncbi:GNAT family N-acetyltransferase [Bacillus testis]|nr:GNAT family N-acetyltransferase [Bacillus testis]